MRKVLAMTLALALASGMASALETATTGSQATQATVGAINSKVDTGLAALQAQNNAMMKCMSQRKFYAPSDPKKDSNGCVGVGDYDLNMASGTNVNLANGLMNGASAGSWAGSFYGSSSGMGSVAIDNTSHNAQLCLNNKCTRSLLSAPVVNVRANSASAWRWPAAAVGCASNEIVTGGGGSCTSGSGDMRITNSIPYGNGWYVVCDTSLGQYATAVVYAMCLVK
jgi:hypothetical protein